MTPGAEVLVLRAWPYKFNSENTLFLQNIHLYSLVKIRQTKYMVIMTKEGSTKIVNFMTHGAGVLVLGCGHISHIVKMHYSFKHLLLYSQA